MASRRSALFDGSNAGLLAAVVAAPLLGLLVGLGPLRDFVRRAGEQQTVQRAEIERILERRRTLSPLSSAERARVAAALAALEAGVAPLGARPGEALGPSLASLFEGAGAGELRVTFSPSDAVAAGPLPLLVAELDGSRPMTLIPNPVRVALTADINGIRRALDALGAHGHAMQLERAELVRAGARVEAVLEIVYWSREAAQ